ncbi:TIGR00725 family protein [Nocardioides sp. LS1]|uniref:SLOG cluster 4 domain-containing protein n=1 Tax=Nocardioides sp. LS1 TaxID=1027620 RepID=UPI000F627FE9|nr:TIGR00725 family protein [Nocardioides sp. LS1]GCD90530.1 lysine decarboxylase [Nocardioides sp. LS1]
MEEARPLAGRYVAVVGPADAVTPDDHQYAEEVGRLLAEAGAVVLTGGHHGVMSSAARGATGAGGVAIGLLPGLDRNEGSTSHTFLLPTGLGELRNGLLVRAADAVVSVGCSWGTLSEIALARRTGVPLALIDPWDLPDDVGAVVPDAEAAVRAVVTALG